MIFIGGGILLLVIAFFIIYQGSASVKAIPGWLLAPSVPEEERFTRYHPIAYSAPIPHVFIPQHPFMAPNAGSNMHNDASMSDTYEARPNQSNPWFFHGSSFGSAYSTAETVLDSRSKPNRLMDTLIYIDI